MLDITSLEDLDALYGDAPINVYKKETDHLTGTYRQWIERAPFFCDRQRWPERAGLFPAWGCGRVCIENIE